MNKFKALLIKDFYINKKTLITPFWITAIFYLLIILSLAVGYFKGDLQIHDFNLENGDFELPGLIFLINMGLLSLPGLIALLFTITITQGSLNEDLRRNCELFHRSQPVSFWLRSLSKYTIGIGGNWAVLFIIALFNYLVVNITLAFLGQFSLLPSITGMLVSFVIFSKITLIIGSITFFLSSIFKDKAFFTGLGILMGIQFLFMILNGLMGWHLPLPLTYFVDLVKFNSNMNIESHQALIDYKDLVSDVWKVGFWNWKTLLQIAVSGLLFAGGSFIYNSKEVK
jgi:hypothetical protein